MFRDAFGRTINNISDYYVRPADEEEYDRGDLQHAILKEKMNGLYAKPELVEAALIPKAGGQPAVIDLGTGSGNWACEMGRAFPEALVVGLDLVSTSFKEPPPSNCRFECDDVNWGLPHYKNCFDVVHARFVCTGLKNYYGLLEDSAYILRPGGVFLSLEGDMQLYNERKEKITAQNPGEEGFSYLQKFFKMTVSMVKDVGSETGAAYLIPTWLQVMGMWETSGVENFLVPIGPWEPNLDAKNRFIAESMRDNMLRLAESYRPLFRSYGMSEAAVDDLLANVKDELVNLRVKMYGQFHACWAVKKE